MKRSEKPEETREAGGDAVRTVSIAKREVEKERTERKEKREKRKK